MIYDVAKIMAETDANADGAVLQATEAMKAGAFSVPHFGLVTSDGGTLYFPAGTYTLQNKVTLPRHCHLVGDGDASVLVFPTGAGIEFEPYPNLNYGNFTSIRKVTIVNDAPSRDVASVDPLGAERHVGIDIRGGVSQIVEKVWLIGWETHIRLSQGELVRGSDLRMYGRQIDELQPTYGIHFCAMGGVSGSTNANWFSLIHFNGPLHPVVHQDGVLNTVRDFHVNQSGTMIVEGGQIVIERGSWEGGPHDECIRTGIEVGIPFVQLCIRDCYVAGDKHLLRITGGSAYGLTVENCFTQATTKALIQNDSQLMSGPVICVGNITWGQAPVWGGHDLYWDQQGVYASAWYLAPATERYKRSGVGIGTMLPTQKVTIKDP